MGDMGGLVCCGSGGTLIKVLGLPMTYHASPGFRPANYEPWSTGQKGWGLLSDHENKVGVHRKPLFQVDLLGQAPSHAVIAW